MKIFYPNAKYLCRKQDDATVNHAASLLKVEMNLLHGKYATHLWKFIKDVNEAFDYIKSRHTKKTKVFGVVTEVRT